MTDHVIKAAKEAGFPLEWRINGVDQPVQKVALGIQSTQWCANLYAIAYRQGIERAAEIVETTNKWRGGKWVSTLCPLTTAAIADAIRAHAQNQPENEHDGSVV